MARRIMPRPLAAAHYLAAQRAGYGSPRVAAAAAARALQRAHALQRTSAGHGAASLSGTWTALGPAPIRESYYGGTNSGRVDAVAVTPNGSEIFVGAAGGGVWSSTDGGVHWITHTDQVSTGLAIGALAIDPHNPQVVYAGTGEGNNCGDCFYGGGVLKSTDGGASWTVENPAGMFTGIDFTGLVVDPSNAQHLIATTNIGVFVSSDGGAGWGQPAGSGDFTDPASAVILDPTHPATVYVATPGVGVQESTDGGANFTTLGGGLPSAATFGVTALAIGTSTGAHPTADQTLYAAVALNGATDPNTGDVSMFKSTDGGANWAPLAIPAYTNQAYAYGTGTADQASYDNTLAVDPANPAHVIAGGIAAVESTDGGASWTNINFQNFFGPENVLHPDFHAATFTPAGSVLLGTDGGVFSYAPGHGPTGVSNLNAGLDITQAYQDLGVSGAGGAILVGTQGAGTALYSGTRTWTDVLSGDGGYGAINPLNPSQQFAETDGRVSVTSDGWVNTGADITPPGEPNPGVTNFVPPLALRSNPAAPSAPTLYYGGSDLWQTSNPGAASPTWTQLTTIGSGVSAIAPAPSDPNVLYVGFDDGTLEVTTNATAPSPSFTVISPGVSEWITHISVSPSNPGQIALSFSSSNTHAVQVPPMVQTGSVTLTGVPAASYVDQTGNLPVGVASNSVLFEGGDLVVATDVGVFSTAIGSLSGATTNWQAAASGLPNVQVIGLTLDSAGNLYAATHGRGVWKLAGSGSPGAPMELTPPRLSGTAAVGHTLTESHGTWSGNPTSYRYQWLRCAVATCTPIAGATAQTYTVSAADVGDTIEVQESATNAIGTSSSATSAPTAAVKPPPPAAAGPPSISGTPRVGFTLVENGAQWTQNPFVFVFQWYRCHGSSCAAIAGATHGTYTLVAADLGTTIKVSEIAANLGGSSAPAISAAVGPVAAAPPPPPPPPSVTTVRHALSSVLATPAPRRAGTPPRTAFTLRFAAPSAGHLTVAWSARLPHARSVVVATLKLTVGRAGHLRLALVLSARGRRLLGHTRRVWIQATGTFAPSGHRAVSLARGFWLSR